MGNRYGETSCNPQHKRDKGQRALITSYIIFSNSFHNSLHWLASPPLNITCISIASFLDFLARRRGGPVLGVTPEPVEVVLPPPVVAAPHGVLAAVLPSVVLHVLQRVLAPVAHPAYVLHQVQPRAHSAVMAHIYVLQH